MSPPAHPADFPASTRWGAGHRGTTAERPPYLCALCQQVLEGRPELSTEDLLQLPGQYLSWVPGALGRGEAGAGLRAVQRPTSTGRLPCVGSRPGPWSHTDECLAACLSGGWGDTVQSALPTSACAEQGCVGPEAQCLGSAQKTPRRSQRPCPLAPGHRRRAGFNHLFAFPTRRLSPLVPQVGRHLPRHLPQGHGPCARTTWLPPPLREAPFVI